MDHTMKKFNTLYESIKKTIKEEKEKAIVGKTVEITGSSDDLGPDYPFKNGDKVKITKFIGYQGNDAEYEIKSGSKTAMITSSMFKII